MEKDLEKKLRERFYHIKGRCNCKTNTSWKRYGWKWIKFERKSVNDFIKDMWESFEEHIKKHWLKNTTIDRIDSGWNYCKENCKWSTRLEQTVNRDVCKKFEYDWKKFNTLKALSIYTWINHQTINQRLKLWWPLKKAVETKAQNNSQTVEYKWCCYKSIRQLCKNLWISYGLVGNRLRRWWTLEKAIEAPKQPLSFKQLKCTHSQKQLAQRNLRNE